MLAAITAPQLVREHALRRSYEAAMRHKKAPPVAAGRADDSFGVKGSDFDGLPLPDLWLQISFATHILNAGQPRIQLDCVLHDGFR